MAKKKCVEVDKTCSDGNKGLSYCINFHAAIDKRCILKDNRCQEHYKNCTKLITENSCTANIGKGFTKICKWDNTSKKRLNADRTKGKRCVLYNGNCLTHKNLCEGLTKENALKIFQVIFKKYVNGKWYLFTKR